MNNDEERVQYEAEHNINSDYTNYEGSEEDRTMLLSDSEKSNITVAENEDETSSETNCDSKGTMPDEMKKSEVKDKHKKFLEAAPKRVDQVTHALERVGFLSNSKNYEYTDDEVAQIIDTIEYSFESMKRNFAGMKSSAGFRFIDKNENVD